MLKSSLLEILRTFSKQELIKFEDFVRSPYFNKKDNVVKLFLILKNHFPDLNDAGLEKEKVWGKLFPDISYNYGIFKNLIFDLSKLAEKFIGIGNYESKKFEQDINLLEELNDRNLLQSYQKNLKILKDEAGKSEFSLNNFYYKYFAEVKEQNFLFHRGSSKDDNFCNPEKMNEFLTANFLINFFAKNYNFIHQSKFYNIQLNTAITDSVIEFFEKSSLVKNELVLIYYLTLKIVKDTEDVDSFLKLKELLKNNFEKFSHKEKFNLHMALVNFCNFKMMKGDTRFVNELFDIYRVMIEYGFYNTGSYKYINPSMYANIVSIAGNLKQFEWAEKFIIDFSHKLHDNNKELYFCLANAALNIKKGNFNEALDFLSKCKSVEAIEKITIKRFQIMIYYESGYFEELYSLIDASRHFISNDSKVTDSAKKIFSNFLLFVQRLADVKSENNKTKDISYDLKKIRKELSEVDVTNKIWLFEKTEQLEK